MSDPPAITALVPVRHFVPRFLRDALESMIGQSSPRWRMIVIQDPALADGLRRLLGEYLDDPRVSAVGNRGLGLGGAINTGMAEATTDYCTVLLGDDLLTPNAVEVLERNIEAHPETDFFHSGKRPIDPEGRPTGGPVFGMETVRAREFLRAAPVKHLLCWRRRFALEIGGLDESFQLVGPDDYDFPWSMAERGASFTLIREVLYLQREHDSYRLTTHPPLRARAAEVMRMWGKHGATGPLGRARALWSAQIYLSRSQGDADRWLRRFVALTRRR